MDEIDLTNLRFLGNKVFEMKRESETITYTALGVEEKVEVESLQQNGRRRYKTIMSTKDACHEIVDSYVNGYTISHNNFLRKGIYTALAVAKGKCPDNVNDEITTG